MRIIQIEVGQMRNFNYLVGCESSGRAALVDPAWEVDRMLAVAAGEGLAVSDILVTHTHPDHVEGLERAWRATGATIHVHAREAAAARSRLGKDASVSPVAPVAPVATVRELADGDTIEVGDIAIHALHTPGHTPGATCYGVPGGIITGDTLFIGRCGRTDFPGSDPAAMFESLRRLAALPEETVVYPGHNYADRPTSTIGHEKVHNIHMAAPDLAEFLRRRMGSAS